jgi:hypothetical protein
MGVANKQGAATIWGTIGTFASIDYDADSTNSSYCVGAVKDPAWARSIRLLPNAPSRSDAIASTSEVIATGPACEYSSVSAKDGSILADADDSGPSALRAPGTTFCEESGTAGRV